MSYSISALVPVNCNNAQTRIAVRSMIPHTDSIDKKIMNYDFPLKKIIYKGRTQPATLGVGCKRLRLEKHIVVVFLDLKHIGAISENPYLSTLFNCFSGLKKFRAQVIVSNLAVNKGAQRIITEILGFISRIWQLLTPPWRVGDDSKCKSSNRHSDVMFLTEFESIEL
ncbi:hypothetical protein BY458DRAFT_489604 [Sporodiniella umbellata]|nr:hypothetical protein BY458DRAFT_489604 [Sporodiniella umbellata]